MKAQMTHDVRMTALTRKRIAAASVARLDEIGLYDADYAFLAGEIGRELGHARIHPDDVEDIAGRVADLVALKMEGAAR